MTGPVRARLDSSREHFQHGPIDLIIEAHGPGEAVRLAYSRAWCRFQGILDELVTELPRLRRPVQNAEGVEGPIARRMVISCAPFLDVFITPMAAVAGAVADAVLAAMTSETGITKAYVNNGGDIAVHLDRGERLRVGLVAGSTNLRHGHELALDGRFEIEASMPVRGIATSGWRGRSWSLGIADSVTILARDAASADAAATIVANEVNIDHPAVKRRRAYEVDDNTDLGDLLVTMAVGPLPDRAIAQALDRGAARAEALIGAGLIWGAVLVLQSRHRVLGGAIPALQSA